MIMTDITTPFNEFYLFGIKNAFLDLRNEYAAEPEKEPLRTVILDEIDIGREADGSTCNRTVASGVAVNFLDFALGLYKPFLKAGSADAARLLMQSPVTVEMLYTLSSMSIAVVMGIYGKNENEAMAYSSALGGEIFASYIFIPFYIRQSRSPVKGTSKVAVEVTTLLGKHSEELISKQIPFEPAALFRYAIGSVIKKQKQVPELLKRIYAVDPRLYSPYFLAFMQRYHALITTYVEQCCKKPA